MRHLLAALLVSAAALGAAAPARADSFSIAFSSGDRYHHDRGWEHEREHDRGWHRGHWDHDRRDRWYYGASYDSPVVIRNTYVTTPIYPQPVAYPVAAQPQGYCREYYGPANVGGRVVQTYGNACLMPDGSWQIMD